MFWFLSLTRSKHTEKLPCPHCGVKVRRLDVHISAKHTPDHEQKYQCQDCGKGFGELRILKAHQMNVHLKLRPYNCRYGCDIAYNDISNRNQHEKRQHGKLYVKYDSRGREIEDKNSWIKERQYSVATITFLPWTINWQK